MYPAKVGEVMQFLIDAPIPGDVKEELLFGWARNVGVRLNSAQFRKVSNSGAGE